MLLPKLSEHEKQLLRIQVEAEIYRRSFWEFFIAASKVLHPQVEWDYNWHFKWLCEILQDKILHLVLNKKKDRDLIINMPFRSGKSILLSQILPVWCWVIDPSLAVMQVSHSELLAVKNSHYSKMLIESTWFKTRFPEIILRLDTHAKGNYMTNQGGKRVSFGIQSSIIGEGADIQIIDDINNPNDSSAVMKTINETYTDTLYSRLNNPETGLRIILQQRVNENDICGYLLDKNPGKYFHVCLPARLDANISPPELSKYYVNGLLWGSRFSNDVLLDFQSTLGSRAFSGQLMQKPVAEEGNVIKRRWFKIITLETFAAIILNKKIEWHVFVDTAYTSKNTNDATAVTLVTKVDNALYLRKAWKFWLEFPELILQLQTIQKQYNVRMIHIESKASGLSVLQQLRRDGFNVTDVSPKDKDKMSRVNATTPVMESGRFVLVEDSSNETVLQEMAGFPYAADDIVDCIVYSIDTLLNGQSFNYGLL